MCTLVAKHTAEGWRVAMNRDEAKTRAEGEPPRLWPDVPMLAPFDPDAGGTWIGARADGTWAAILNGYLDDGSEGHVTKPKTRGRLIPEILAERSPVKALREMDLSHTRSFRLWIGWGGEVTEFFWDGQTLTENHLLADEWLMTTSSSLRQDDVKAARRAVFSQWLHDGAALTPEGLPLLLTERGPLDAEEAVLMERSYSHTKSCTLITAGTHGVRMQHWEADRLSGEPVGDVRL
ncbi:hypothetical protein HK107_11855 [Parvularcula sp. ZS-1/3]|uniref:NRDE family protein n=1 Tax=Parvularcula mediterranea TaxID=2732508 RepID=A0A7Y3W5Q6_9PROT|nr:NRDE family protein [Parvularcula mediterranea]NNU17015.1 hypothetical protein [Parvularcula mediterranea]